jgi:hypothetical protein
MEKWKVDEARREASEAYTKMSLLKDAALKAEADYIKKLARFRNFDYELAQTDGRLKKLPPQGERKTKKQPELTLEQLRTIAEKLGFNLNTIEETEETEEVIEALMEDKSHEEI